MLSSSAQERLIARIAWNCVPVVVQTVDKQLLSLLLKTPTAEAQAKAAVVYDTEFQKALMVGLSSEDVVLDELIKIGRWSNDKEATIVGLQNDIKTIRRGLLDLFLNKTQLAKAKSVLRNAEEVLTRHLYAKYILLQNSAEAHAELMKQRSLIYHVTETIDHSRFWLTTEDFDNYTDNFLINQLCELFFHKTRIPSKEIRELARSQHWRSYWEIARQQAGHLFDSSIANWSSNQRELVYWSTIYDSVYGAYERPCQEIIDDDDLLDSWFIRQGEAIENRSKQHAVPSSNQHVKNGIGEQFIPTDKAGAKIVYEMNKRPDRITVQARQKKVNSDGTVLEQHMPDSQLGMKQQLAEMQRNRLKRS